VNAGDPADSVRACLQTDGGGVPVEARPRSAGVYDPSQRPRPELRNWITDEGCVSYAGAAPNFVERPDESKTHLPTVTQ
jgi:hypothetical protein